MPAKVCNLIKAENTLVLGEAAAVFALSHSADRATAKITGYWFCQ